MNKRILKLAGAAILAVLAYGSMSTGNTTRLTISIAVGIPSLALMILSRRQLGESFAVTAKAKALVTTGLYSRIQHPMYLFLDLFLLCVLIVADIPLLLFAWVLLVIVQTLQSWREEKVLSAAFGMDYQAYINHTWI